MTEDDKLPRFSYDLIHALDASVPKVVLPVSAKGAVNFTENLTGFMWEAARRSLVDELLAALQEEEDGYANEPAEASDEAPSGASPDHEKDWAMGEFPRVFDTGGSVRVLQSPRRTPMD